MKYKVVVLGGKGTAVVVAEHIHDANLRGADIELLGYAFDDPAFGTEINGTPILCGTRDAYQRFGHLQDVRFIFQMYRSDLMKERVALRESFGIPLERYHTFVHPSAVVMKSVRLGHGTVVMAGVVIMPNAVIGDHCTVLAATTIGHDTSMGDNNFLATHVVLGSGCRIGERNFFGMNVTVNTRASLGDDCHIAMASNVVRDLPNGSRVRGNPARPYEGVTRAT